MSDEARELLVRLEFYAVSHTESVASAIVKALGRMPNDLETALIGTMWSEHSGYNHSKPLLEVFDEVNAKLEARP